MNPRKLLFFVSEDWYFWSHRRLLAKAAMEAGYQVCVMTQVAEHGQLIKDAGFTLLPLKIDRHGKNIFRDIVLLLEIVRIYRKQAPDIVHHIALKPIVYGKIAALFSGVRFTVNTFPGLGYIFYPAKRLDKMISFLILFLLRVLLRAKYDRVIVQNNTNRDFLLEKCVGTPSSNILIQGSGVDLNEYGPDTRAGTDGYILFASRLIEQKGIRDYVEAAKLVRQTYPELEFLILGKPDHDNPNSITEDELREWQGNKYISWLGYRQNVAEVMSDAMMMVLPSFYGEGVPKVLIEAAACALPIITTDIPGCRDIVKHQYNGLLVDVNQPGQLAESITRLYLDAKTRQEYGKNGRARVEQYFSSDIVNKQTLDVYNSLLT